MTPRKLILLLLALAIAGGTVMMARKMLTPGTGTPVTADGKPVAAPVEILVIGRDVPAGTLLKDTDLRWQTWPAEAQADNMIVKGKQEKAEYVGAVTRQGMRNGEPILIGRIVKAQEQGFLSAVLEPGMRAISIKVTAVTGVAGLVFPGDRVDVILTHVIRGDSGEGGEERRVSETVITNARVLALDQKTDDQATEPKVAEVATLEVSPKEAEKIALMSGWGTLALVLRSVANAPVVEDAPASSVGVVPADPSALPPVTAPDFTWDSDVSRVLPQPPASTYGAHKVQILRGKDQSETTFNR